MLLQRAAVALLLCASLPGFAFGEEQKAPALRQRRLQVEFPGPGGVFPSAPKKSKGGFQVEKIVDANDLLLVSVNGSPLPPDLQPLINAFGYISMGCTATHIGNGLVLTAGHCFLNSGQTATNKACDTVSVRFGFFTDAAPYLTTKCKLLIAAENSYNRDYALFSVENIPPVAIPVDARGTRAPEGLRITIFGHPQGRPLSWSQTCTLIPNGASGITNLGTGEFAHECDTEPGNSGSTIVDLNTKKVIGIHNGALDVLNYATYITEVSGLSSTTPVETQGPTATPTNPPTSAPTTTIAPVTTPAPTPVSTTAPATTTPAATTAAPTTIAPTTSAPVIDTSGPFLPAQQSCTVLYQNTDFFGGDIGQVNNIPDPNMCCALCTNDCELFTWSSWSGGTCFLKSSKVAASINVIPNAVGAVSGLLKGKTVTPMDFIGQDIGASIAPTPNDCFSICRFTPGCGAFAWNSYQGGTCWLKAKALAVAPSAGVIAGVLPLPAARCSIVQSGIIFNGGTIASFPNTAPGACCGLCASNSDCQLYTWAAGTCNLKTTVGMGTLTITPTSSDVKSGIKGGTGVSSVVNDVEIVGGSSIASMIARTAEDCFQYCLQTPGCTFFTWFSNVCALRQGAGSYVTKSGARSAIIAVV